MNQKKTSPGFISLHLVMMLVMIGTLLFAALVAKGIFTAQSSHRLILNQQAVWLAESAVERAVAAIAAATDPATIQTQSFNERIAPIYIETDPLMEAVEEKTDMEEEGKQPDRSISVRYSYNVIPIKDPTRFGSLIPDGKTVYQITGKAEIPYRSSTLSAMTTQLCMVTKAGKWTMIPLRVE